MSRYYTRPPKADGSVEVDIPFHNSVIGGVARSDVICLKGEGKRYPQGSLEAVRNRPIINPVGEDIGLLYLAICRSCEKHFHIVYEFESGGLFPLYTRER